MKTEFFYNRSKYVCSLNGNSDQELRIRNSRGLVLAVQKGNNIGLIGKNRQDAEAVDVSQPQYYNLIKTAINAIQLESFRQELKQHQLLAESLQQQVCQREEQIILLQQQILLLKQEHYRLSHTQQQQLAQLQQQAAQIEQGKQAIASLKSNVKSNWRENLETEIQQYLGGAWQKIARASKNEIFNCYRQYQLIDSENFVGTDVDYSTAGLGFCLVTEREIMKPFFRGLYQFLAEKDSQAYSFQVGDITIKARGKHTLGDLPMLLSGQWQSLRREILAKNCSPTSNQYNYQTVYFGNRISRSDRQLIQSFLQQWKHPLALWFKHAEYAASTIDEIRQLRNRATHSEDVFYPWQFERLRLLIVGSKTKAGILKQIYQ